MENKKVQLEVNVKPAEKMQVDFLGGVEIVTIKGKDGIDGKTPTNEEVIELIKPLIPEPIKGEDGKTPTTDELLSIIEPLIPDPIPGEKGQDGRDAIVDEDAIVVKVLTKIPRGKTVKFNPDTGEQILEKIKGKIDYEDIHNVPNIQAIINQAKQSSKTVSLRELDDVNLTGLTTTNGKYNLGGSVTSVDSSDNSITSTPPTGPAIDLGLNMGNSNSWTANQYFAKAAIGYTTNQNNVFQINGGLGSTIGFGNVTTNIGAIGFVTTGLSATTYAFGGLSGTTLINTTGTLLFSISGSTHSGVDSSGNWGFGQNAGTARVNIIRGSGAQILSGFNSSNYFTASTDSNGITTFDAQGTSPSFRFSDDVDVNQNDILNAYIRDAIVDNKSTNSGTTLTGTMYFATAGDVTTGTVTGIGTLFSTELKVGDKINNVTGAAGGEFGGQVGDFYIKQVVSNTSFVLTRGGGSQPTGAGSAFSAKSYRAQFSVADTSGVINFAITDGSFYGAGSNNYNLGALAPNSFIWNGNAFFVTGTNAGYIATYALRSTGGWQPLNTVHGSPDLSLVYDTANGNVKGNLNVGNGNLYVASTGSVGINTASPSASLHVIKTTEQIRTGYDATNYMSTTVNSTGNATFDLVASSGTPGFTFADNVTITGSGTMLTVNGNVVFNNGLSVASLSASAAGSAANPDVRLLGGAAFANGLYTISNVKLGFAAGGAAVGAVSSATGWEFVGKLSNYNSIATAGWGVPAIYGSGRSTAQTAAVASVATYTVGAADGSFEVSANVLVTTATAHSFNVTVAYTDEGNTARTVTLNFSTLAGVISNAAITNVAGAVPYDGVPLHIRCKASTAITIATTGTFTTVTYNVEGIIKQTS
jgi:hypothetical protein